MSRVEIEESITGLSDLMEDVRSLNYGPGLDWHNVLTVAAFAKAYDFAVLATDQSEADIEPFWVVASLRGILEDIIVLAALGPMPRQDRDDLLRTWMLVATTSGMEKQARFFASHERLQSVLTPSEEAKNSQHLKRDEMRDIWKKHGLDPGRNGQGNVRKMAEASGLLDLYDFLYDLASRLVHFSPGVLLRMGWGDVTDERREATFRPANFGRYYAALATGYSSLLLAEFIERFGPSLRLDEEFATVAVSIRAELSQVRLPELVTYEEMNAIPPNAAVQAIEALVRSGDLSAGR